MCVSFWNFSQELVQHLPSSPDRGKILRLVLMNPESTDRRFSRNLSNEGRDSISLQKKLAESKRVISRNEQVPGLTEFMNDLFYGARNTEKKPYNLTGSGRVLDDHVDEDFDSSTRSASSRLTQEWLQEAKRIVASSPSRIDSPSRLVGSPRFATSRARLSTSSLEKRDPFDRSARR